MSKPVRSPLTGYNHNVQYLARVFHVQTEDSGPVNPHIFTHLFFGGTILVSKKHRYDATTPDDTVRKLMQAQHKAMLRELVQAQHDERIRGFFAAKGEVLPTETPGAQPAAPMPAVESQPMAATAPMEVTLTPPPLSARREPGTPGPLTPGPLLPGQKAAPLGRALVDPGRTPPPLAQSTPAPMTHAQGAQMSLPGATSLPDASSALPLAAAQPAPVRGPVVPSTSPRLQSPAARAPGAGQQPVRAPYARGGQQTVATSSADGVVIQRSIVVGTRPRAAESNAGASPGHRPTAAFRATGGASAPEASATPQPAQGKSARGATPATGGQHNGATATPAWGAAVTPAPTAVRPMGPLVDDKSLDEVILEYLADDTVDEGLG